MAIGDILVDGKRQTKKVTGQQMCEYIVAADIYVGFSAEDLWNYSARGELTQVFDMYWYAHHVRGHRVELEIGGGVRVLMFQELDGGK